MTAGPTSANRLAAKIGAQTGPSIVCRRLGPTPRIVLAPLGKGFLRSLSLCLDIGIPNTAPISAGLRFGVAPAFWIGLGSCFGDLACAALSLAGLAPVMGYAPLRWIFWLLGSAGFARKMARAAWNEARGRATPTARPAIDRNIRGGID